MPDNELEVAEGLHVEDIDCNLIVRPTRTALDLTLFGEVRRRVAATATGGGGGGGGVVVVFVVVVVVVGVPCGGCCGCC